MLYKIEVTMNLKLKKKKSFLHGTGEFYQVKFFNVYDISQPTFCIFPFLAILVS